MKLVSLDKKSIQQKLTNQGLTLDMGLVGFNIKSKNPLVISTLTTLYGDYKIVPDDEWFDFNISIESPKNLRNLIKRQVSFKLDAHKPFLPLPYAHSYPLLEWGMNWCVANHHHKHLILHAAVLEKNGHAFIFPAPPGSGKSTLCSYLALSGWRLLSDEMAIIDLTTGRVKPFVRPICLKNNSIDLVQEWFPNSVLSPIAKDTNKGNVAHVKPPAASVSANNKEATVRAIVFPKFTQNSSLTLYSMNNCQALVQLAENAFNHEVLGGDGFNALCKLVENSDVLEIHYHDLGEVIDFLSEEFLSA